MSGVSWSPPRVTAARVRRHRDPWSIFAVAVWTAALLVLIALLILVTGCGATGFGVDIQGCVTAADGLDAANIVKRASYAECRARVTAAYAVDGGSHD